MKQHKTEKITFRCNKDEKMELQLIANDLGVSKSFLLHKGLEAIITQINK